MSPTMRRTLAGLVLTLAAGGIGYISHSSAPVSQIPAQTVSAPPVNSVRVIYSLDKKQNDQEIIALINGAQKYVYFAMYEFTLQDIADALIAAKARGVDVEGLVDSGESANSYDKPVIASLLAAHIPVKTEKHADGNGIMHIKAIATDKAYALGSYNWTGSATTENDELLEIGTDPNLIQTYSGILKRLIDAYPLATAAPEGAAVVSGTYDYTQAPAHVGEYASVRGTVVDAYTSKTGTVFFDYCKSYKSCPFSAVIFADDVSKFGDLTKYSGQTLTLTGKISSYQGQPEMILNFPNQIK